MKLSDASQAAVRVAQVNEKVRKGFEDQLRKWFSTHFVKGANLDLMRSIHQAGAYPAFAQLLSEAPDAERSSILAKLDKHRSDMQMRSKAEIMGHIEGLASGRIEVTSKPKTPTKPRATKPAKKKVGIISNNRY